MSASPDTSTFLETECRPAADPTLCVPQFGLTQALYGKFQRLIYGETGIWLGDSKRALLCGRLSKRLRSLQLASLRDYYQLVGDPAQQDERTLMIDAITTNETHFFREPKHFEFLAREIIPGWRKQAEHGQRPKSLRIWSAGCSSGEEPYSIAMLLALHFPPEDGWDVQVIGSDISTRVLEKARKGVYSMAASREIPKHMLRQFMLKGVGQQAAYMKVAPEIQQSVRFAQINLSQGPFAFEASFDLIFCRNVLIYFDKDSKRNVVQNLAACLREDGLLLIGHAENLNGISPSVRGLAPTIYCKTESYSRMLRNFRSA